MSEATKSSVTLHPRRRSIFFKLLLVFGGIIVALVIVEVALRVSGFTYFSPYIVDEDLGFALRPGAEGWWKIENRTYIKNNSAGFRDREHAIEKPPGTLRIAVIGDSFTEAMQVADENAFWAVLERRLQNCPIAGTSKVEVLSFGVSGLSTARELILLEKRVWRYSPDVIVLQVTSGNDIRDNSRTLSVHRNQPFPYFIFQGDKLVMDDSLLAQRLA